MSNIYESPQAKTSSSIRGESEGLISEALVRHISRGRPWAKILSVFSYIFFGFIVLGVVAIALSLAFVPLSNFREGLGGAFADVSSSILITGGIVYLGVLIVMAILTFFIAKSYGRYGKASSELLASNDPEDVLESFNAFASLLKYVTFTFVIVFSLAVVAGIVFAIYASNF